MNDENLPYRSHFPGGLTVPTDDEQTSFSKDEQEFSTLETIYKIMRDELAELKGWQKIDLTETELKVKQQIKAHQIAVDLLEPLVESMLQALGTVNEKYREK